MVHIAKVILHEVFKFFLEIVTIAEISIASDLPGADSNLEG